MTNTELSASRDFTPATRGVLTHVESSKIVFFAGGFRSEPRWGSLRWPPDPPSQLGRGILIPIPHTVDAFGVSTIDKPFCHRCARIYLKQFSVPVPVDRQSTARIIVTKSCVTFQKLGIYNIIGFACSPDLHNCALSRPQL